MSSKNNSRKPEWLRVRLPVTSVFARVDRDLQKLNLNTVCKSAKCPNIYECFSRKTATFLILGNRCTRNCGFCNIEGGTPEIIDPSEPQRISDAASILGLKHIVITSVTRDDLDDGGSRHFARVLSRLKKDHPGSTLEVLVPDFKGDGKAVDRVLESGPDVFGHNMETVRRLYPVVRPKARYKTGLDILEYAGKAAPMVRVKTGIMAGLGEDDSEIKETLEDICGAGCQVVTIGQYLRPSGRNLEVKRYIIPEKFEWYGEVGRKLGLVMFCGPLVRSSYRAETIGLTRC